MVRGLEALFGRSAEPRPPPRAPSPHEAQATVYTSAPAASAASAVSASTSTAPLPRIDAAEAQYWEYPEAGTGSEFRSYQHVMTREALAANTLVSLPTGFGKTFVAAAVMRNFLRWFPDGLVVFMAPARPLVHQQRDACAKAGLPADGEAALLTGDLPPSERRALWSTGHGSEGWRREGRHGWAGGADAPAAARRLFFCTPQTFENDWRQSLRRCGNADLCLPTSTRED